MLTSPLDQFRIIPILMGSFIGLDLSFTNSALIMFLSLGSFLFIAFLYIMPRLILTGEAKAFLVPNNRWFSVLENLYNAIRTLLADNVGKVGQPYFPFYFVVFIFVLQANLIGLIPYSFTTTSHIIVTFSLALIIFVGVNNVGVELHKQEYLNLFLPTGTAFALSFLLVPLEIVSFLSKPISLSVRLFANMMAGHTLLKVIAGFAWSMMKGGTLLFIAHVVPLLVLFLLVGLELGVALIQAYVFIVLSCIYLNDSIHLH
jgi:ATP synthase subunit 6